MNATVYLACRNPAKAEAAVADIKATTGNDAVASLPLDLESLASVREFGSRFNSLGHALDLLVNNAGLSVANRTTTKDGLEKTLQVRRTYTADFSATTFRKST